MARRDASEPEIEFLPSESEVERMISVGSTQTRSRMWAAGLAVAVVLAVVVIVTSDDPATRGPTDATTSTSVDSTPATAIRVGPGAGPLLVTDPGLSVLTGDGSRWRLLNLATGDLRDVPALDGVGRDQIIPISGGVIVLIDGGTPTGHAVHQPLPDGDREDLNVSFDDNRIGAVAGLVPSGRSDRFWLLQRFLGPDSTLVAGLVELPARVVSGPFQIDSFPLAGTEQGLIYSAGGRTVLVNDEGTRHVADGEASGASADSVGILSCGVDPGMSIGSCDTTSINLDTGARLQAEPTPFSSDDRWVAVAPNGSIAMYIGDPAAARSTTISIATPSGSNLRANLNSPVGDPQWLPDSSGLIALTDYGLTIISIGPTSATTRVIEGFRTGQDDTLILVPHRVAPTGSRTVR